MLDNTYVGDVDGLTEGAFGTEMLLDDVHGTIDEGKVACLDGTCVGDVNGPTEGAIGAEGFT